MKLELSYVEYHTILRDAGILPVYDSDNESYAREDICLLIDYLLNDYETDDKDELQKLRIEILRRELQSISDSQYEYNTKHDDAGDAYAHMPQESAIHCSDYRQNGLVEYCDEQYGKLSTKGYRPTDKEFARDVLCHLLDMFDMEPTGIYGVSSGFVLDSYIVGEIEEQLEYSMLAANTDLDIDVVRSLIESDCITDFCIRHPYSDHCYVYINAEYDVWTAVSTDESIREAITTVCIARCHQVDKNRKGKTK